MGVITIFGEREKSVDTEVLVKHFEQSLYIACIHVCHTNDGRKGERIMSVNYNIRYNTYYLCCVVLFLTYMITLYRRSADRFI